MYYAATCTRPLRAGSTRSAVVGGGNSAGQAALFLADKLPRVYLIVRGPDLAQDMSRYLIAQLEHHQRVEILLNTEVSGLSGDKSLSSVELVDNKTGEKRAIDARALFIFIGASPNPGGSRAPSGSTRRATSSPVETPKSDSQQDIRSPSRGGYRWRPAAAGCSLPATSAAVRSNGSLPRPAKGRWPCGWCTNTSPLPALSWLTDRADRREPRRPNATDRSDPLRLLAEQPGYTQVPCERTRQRSRDWGINRRVAGPRFLQRTVPRAGLVPRTTVCDSILSQRFSPAPRPRFQTSFLRP